MNFYELMATLARMGVWEVVLPFLLVFTIVYAVLTTLTFFKDEDNKRFATIVSLVIGLGVVIPHSIGAYPKGMNVVIIINNALPRVALIAVAIIGIFILLGLFGIELNFNNAPIMSLVVGVCTLAVIYIFATAGGTRYRIPRFLSFLSDPDTQALLIVVLVFGLIVKFIVGSKKDDSKNNKTGYDKFREGLEKINGLFRG